MYDMGTAMKAYEDGSSSNRTVEPEPGMQFILQDTQTYSRILAHSLSNIEQAGLKESWVVLLSKKYETVHFLCFKDAAKSQ